MLVPVATFVVTGEIAAILWEEPVDAGLVIWQAFVLWPVGAALVIGPVSIVRVIDSPTLRWAGSIVISVAAAVAMVLVASSDDAQAGTGFLYAPVLGALGASLLVVVDRVRRRRSNR